MGWEAAGIRAKLNPSSKLAIHRDGPLPYEPPAFVLSIRQPCSLSEKLFATLNTKQQFGGRVEGAVRPQRSQQASTYTLPQDAEVAGPCPVQMPIIPCPV